MPLLNQTRISLRIYILVLLPLVAIALLAFERYKNAHSEYQSAADLSVILTFLGESSKIINALQLERDYAMTATSDKGDHYKKQFLNEVEQTDKQIKAYLLYIKNNPSLKNVTVLQGNIDNLKSKIDRVYKARIFVSQGEKLMDDNKMTIKQYNDAIGAAINLAVTVAKIASKDKHLSLPSNAYLNFIIAKESQSLNVGVLQRLLKQTTRNAARDARFQVTWNTSEKFFRLFQSFAPNTLSEKFEDEYFKSEDRKTLYKRLIHYILSRTGDTFTAAESEKLYKLGLNTWQSTHKMENDMRQYLLAEVSITMDKAKNKLEQTITLFVLILVLNTLLAALIIRSILYPLRLLVNNFHKITLTNNLDQAAPVIGNDEFAEASQSFNRLIETIKEKNEHIRTLLSNMAQGLFTINTDTIVGDEYSDHLESIFQQKELGGSNAISLLFDDSDLNDEQINQVIQVLSISIGDSLFGFEINADLLPIEYKKTIKGTDHTLQLEWNPITKNDSIEHILVTVRDVTELKAMEEEVKEKSREIELVEQLIPIAKEKFSLFYQSATALLKENKSVIKSNNREQQDLELMFRNMHTLKGNARTYGFTYISERAHSAENYFSELTEENCIWNDIRLLEDINQLEKALSEYHHVYIDVLGRGDGKEDGIWLDAKMLAKLTRQIEELQSELNKLGKSELSKGMFEFLTEGEFFSLEYMLDEILKSLPQVAHDLGKEAPHISIKDNNIKLNKDCFSLINNTFAHLLTNSIDHGIEKASERDEKGKTEHGNITIELARHNNQASLTISDDGKGLDIAALYQRGVEQSAWQQGQAAPFSEIAELIFQSGITTKENVTDISGRGVGLDAVREYIHNHGCKIEIVCDDGEKLFIGNDEACFVNFKFVIQLPCKFHSSSERAA